MTSKSPPILVSACLLGANCAYDLRNNNSEATAHLARQSATIAVCPEEIAGLGTPRPACHLMADGNDILDGEGQVVTDANQDVTADFVKAAKTVLALAKEHGVKKAFLKSKSPSCGAGAVKIDQQSADGWGVTAALLTRHGIEVVAVDSDEQKARANPNSAHQPPTPLTQASLESFDV